MLSTPRIAHPLARRSLQHLDLPIIHTRYRAGVTERLYTNLYGGRYSQYPNPRPVALQAAYARAICELDRPQAHSTRVDPSHVLFTSGSFMGIDLLIRVFCESGEDAICITTPTFPPYATIAMGLGIGVIDVPLAGASFDTIDVDRIVATKAKLTFLCSPNNPISTGLDPASILAVAERSCGLVVVDEAYIELGRRRSLADRVASYPNLVVLRTLSKAWGLAGLRAGVIIAHPTVLNTVRIVQDPFACSIPMQEEVTACLADLESARLRIDRTIADRNALVVALRDLPAVDHVFNSETNFAFCRVVDHAKVLAALAVRPDVLAADGSAAIPGGIKVSLGTAEENAALLDVIASRAT